MLVKLPHGGLIKLRCPKRRPNGNLYGFQEKMLGRPRGPVWTMKIQRMDSQGALIVFKFIGVSIFFHGKRWKSLLQASNLVDFMEGAENSSALCAMMDDRSNPETYQVSRVAAPRQKVTFFTMRMCVDFSMNCVLLIWNMCFLLLRNGDEGWWMGFGQRT